MNWELGTYTAGLIVTAWALCGAPWDDASPRERVTVAVFVSLVWPAILITLTGWALIYGPGLVMEARRDG